MATPMKDETYVLRDTLRKILAAATTPLSSIDLCDHADIKSLGLKDMDQVARELSGLYHRKNQPWPLVRIPAAQGRSQWEYYNPDVVKLRPTARRDPPEAPVNAVNPPPDFQFNAADFLADVAQAVPTAVPETPAAKSTVKSITVTVHGVSIKIDIESGG